MPSEISWRPDKNSEMPIYEQIVEHIRDQVAGGDILPGYRIPSQRELAEKFQVNRSTVNTAIDELVSLGILKTEVGRGTFVEDDMWNSLIKTSSGWDMHKYHGLFIENTDPTRKAHELIGNYNYIDLGSNDLSSELTPTSYIRNALKYMPMGIDSLNYLPPLGHYGLRSELTRQLAGKGIMVKPENILITSGSVQALHLISLALVKKNTTLFTEEPSYINTLNIFPSMSINMKTIAMDDEGISIDKLSKTVGKNNAPSLLYTIPNYQNPTNILMSQSRRENLIKFCMRNKIVIIEDDAYGDLWFEKRPPRPLKAYDKNGFVLYMGTISQTLSAGLRIGWIVGSKSIIKRLSDVKMQIDYGTSSLSQMVLRELFESGAYNKYLETLRPKLKVKRDFLLRLLDMHLKDLCTWTVPNGGYHIWLKFKDKLSVEKLFHAAIEKMILLDPNPGITDKKASAIRLSYSYADYQDMVTAVKTLKKIILKIR